MTRPPAEEGATRINPYVDRGGRIWVECGSWREPFEFDADRVPVVGEWIWDGSEWWKVWRVLWGRPEHPIHLLCEPVIPR